MHFCSFLLFNSLVFKQKCWDHLGDTLFLIPCSLSQTGRQCLTNPQPWWSCPQRTTDHCPLLSASIWQACADLWTGFPLWTNWFWLITLICHFMRSFRASVAITHGTRLRILSAVLGNQTYLRYVQNCFSRMWNYFAVING